MRPSFALAVACLALAGCATAADSEPKPKGVAKYEGDPRLGEKVDKLCFTSNIDSFGNNTRDTFTVREGRDYYLIEVFGSCLSLEHAMTVRLPTSSICLRPGDHVIVSDSLTGHGDGAFSTQRCTVNAIYNWDPKAKDKVDEEKTGEESEAPAEES
ncbi:MAG TPA: DUF6491 family protein [Hyphomonas sp.]|nr:DUF6491 family protein [Hyphomonas sp.]